MNLTVDTAGLIGRDLNHRWHVGRLLGSGSFGVVHEGVERATGVLVAIKFLRPQFLHQSEAVGRFWNEAEVLRRLDHPNILVLLDAGASEEGVPYLVTELLQGETMRELLDREGPLPPERAMRLLGPAAHALHHAHHLGIVHRDLKPENVFRVRRDGLGTTKILDFGMAKLLDTQTARKLSQTGMLIGTMAYSPPEQLQGLPDVDHRADQFGFAALMFEALTGHKPFPQSQPFALFQAIISGERPRASLLRHELPPATDQVLMRALDPDRERRYPNLEAFYFDISAALTGMPVHPAPALPRSISNEHPVPVPPDQQTVIAAAEDGRAYVVPGASNLPPEPSDVGGPVVGGGPVGGTTLASPGGARLPAVLRAADPDVGGGGSLELQQLGTATLATGQQRVSKSHLMALPTGTGTSSPAPPPPVAPALPNLTGPRPRWPWIVGLVILALLMMALGALVVHLLMRRA